MSLDELLQQWGQTHLLSSVQTGEERNRILQDLLSFDRESLDRQMRFSSVQKVEKKDQIFRSWVRKEKKASYREKGEELLLSGKAAALMLAAGEGTRFGFSAPKGTFLLTSQKSLFQIFCEKILSAQKRCQREIFLMIMTSPLNIQETRCFFEQNQFFGLKKQQVAFFSQGLLPLTNVTGKWFLENGSIAARASGNGDLYRSLQRVHLLETCREKGVEHFLVFPVDNPLADPCDADLLGYSQEHGCEVTIKAIRRPKKEISMGVLAEDSSQIHIVEYMDIAPKEMASFLYANTGLYCMSLSFLEKAATLSFPLHRVQKTIRWDGGEKEVCKYERFLFDAFGISKKTGALVAPKSSCFAPLKRLKGKDGVASVRKAFLLKERTACLKSS